MKIGILTHHHIHNDGAILQAYAQVNALKEYFPDYQVEIIDLWLKKWSTLDEKSLRSGRGKLLHEFIENRLPLSEKRLITDDYFEALDFVSDYDMLILGSDEVWKLEWRGKYQKTFPNVFWLHPDLKCTKIAMAASANRLIYKDRDKQELQQMKKYLDSFELLGVRDNYTVEFIINYLGIKGKVFKVCDPTIPFTFSEIDLTDKLTALGIDLNKPVAGVRMDRIQHGKIAELCKKQLKGYQTVSLNNYNKYTDFNLTGHIDPLEWANVFKYLDFCITDSYHCTIFSIKNNVPLKVIDHDKLYRGTETKTYDILRDMDMLYCYEDIKSILKKYKVDSVKLNSLKQTYINFLGKVKEYVELQKP